MTLVFGFWSWVLVFGLWIWDSGGPSDAYLLGNRKVRIPAPDGFTEISARFDLIAGRFRATEDPGNDFLGVHVPEPFVSKLKASQDIDLEFYTKISISKRARSIDLTPELFAGVVSHAEKNTESYLDPNGPLMKRLEANAGKGLTELFGKEVGVDVTGQRSLGVFEKSNKVFSEMIMLNMELYGRKITTLYSSSFVYVNRRLIFVFVYKMAPKTDDVRMLRDFTKKWTAKIIAANK